MPDACHCVLFSDNQPTVLWVCRMAANISLVASQLLQALVLKLKLKLKKVSLLTPLHIQGKDHPITDIPSHSFGSEPQWHCPTDADLLTLFNREGKPPQPAILDSIPPLIQKENAFPLWLHHQSRTWTLWTRMPGAKWISISSAHAGCLHDYYLGTREQPCKKSWF